LDLLLREPPAEPAAIEAAAADAEWKLPASLAVLAFSSAQPQRVMGRLPAECLAGDADGVKVALVPDPDAPRRRRAIEAALDGAHGGLGHTVEWRDAPESALRARIALGLAPGPDTGLVVAGERLLDVMLARDPALTAALRERALAPLEALRPAQRERLAETLRAWLDAHGEVRPAAERLHVHTQTVRYRLDQLAELFGDALSDPALRLELALALRD
jgi:hypothetical protein